MDEAARKEATYADLYSLPEDTVGEIIDGELIAVPRPSRKHGFSAYALGGCDICLCTPARGKHPRSMKGCPVGVFRWEEFYTPPPLVKPGRSQGGWG